MGSKTPPPDLSEAPDYPRPYRLDYYTRLYGPYHNQNEKFLAGKLTAENVQGIARMVDWWHKTSGLTTQPRLLDYGSGKGYQYLSRRIHEEWGGSLPYCYDPGVFHFSKRPKGRFDGIICTDVMEHLEEQDVLDVLADLRAYATKPAFLYMTICCRKAWKKFDDGSNLHKTIKPPEWWEPLIKHAFKGSEVVVRRSYVLPAEGQEDGVEAGAGDTDPSAGHPLPDGPGEGTDAGGEGNVPAQEDQGGDGVRPEEASRA